MSAAQKNGAGGEIARRPDRTPLSQRDPVQLAQHFAASGYFRDAADMSKAVVKIVAGEELGFGPMTAMAGIHIIEGKPSLSANLIATLVKRHELYDYRVDEITPERASLTFFFDGAELGPSEFTLEQAKRARLVKDGSGWVKFPEAMLFARALTQGVRWYCPDVTAGSPAYTPEELGADVDERGEFVEGEVVIEDAESTETPTLDTETAERIIEGVEVLGLTLTEVDLILGGLGVDGLRARSVKARDERIKTLTDGEAEAVLSELDKVAETGAQAQLATDGDGS